MNRRSLLAAGVAGLARAQRSARGYRVVLIGDTGHGDYGHDWDLAWRTVPGATVVAVADPDAGGRARAMARSGASGGYSDYRDMIAKEKPDIVTICPRWPDRRVEMVRAAAESRCHVLVEKPLARTLEEADAVVAAVEASGIRMQVGHTARPMPVTGRVRAMLREGELGTLLEIRARGKEDRRAGGEDLVVLGTHDFDLMRYFAGDPRWVFANVLEGGRPARAGRRASEPVGPVAGDEIAAMFGFDGGVHGYFASRRSEDTSGVRFGVTLYGSKGWVYVPLTNVPGVPPYLLRDPAWVGASKAGGWERVEYPAGFQTSREHVNAVMARDLIGAIEEKREPACGARDGRSTIEMVTGIYQSHFSGRPVAFPLADRRCPVPEA